MSLWVCWHLWFPAQCTVPCIKTGIPIKAESGGLSAFVTICHPFPCFWLHECSYVMSRPQSDMIAPGHYFVYPLLLHFLMEMKLWKIFFSLLPILKIQFSFLNIDIKTLVCLGKHSFTLVLPQSKHSFLFLYPPNALVLFLGFSC